jgi:hypothetical protein
MTHQELKAIIDGGEYCIQCPSDYATNERWKKYIENVGRSCRGTYYPMYYSPTPFAGIGNIGSTPESKTVITLDQWWSVIGDDNGTTAWQPKEGELVDATDEEGNWEDCAESATYLCSFKGWHIVMPQDGKYPIGYKHIRPIQTIPVSLDDLKAAYTEKHNIDVNKITVT